MELTPAIRQYVLHWGEMGTRWGTNRTVAQIHALLYLSPEPLRADEEQIGGIIHGPMFERLILSDYVVADLFANTADDVGHELGATGDIAAEFVGAAVRVLGDEVGDQVAHDAADLDHVVASLDNAATAILRSAAGLTGQACQSLERIYVHRSIFPEFLESLVGKAKRIRRIRRCSECPTP